MNNRYLSALLLGGMSLGITGCDSVKDAADAALDALGVTVDVTGSLNITGGGTPSTKTVTLYAPSENPGAFDTSVCPEVSGQPDPTCYGRINTGGLDTPVETGATEWSGDDFTVKGAAVTSDLAFIAVLTGSGDATCNDDIIGYEETTKLATIATAVTVNFDDLDPEIPVFELPRDGTINCEAPIEDPVVDEEAVEEPEAPPEDEDIGGDGDGWTTFTISDGSGTPADASTGDVASADNPIDCGPDSIIAPTLTVDAECDGCGDVAYIRTQFGYGEDAIFTSDPVPVAGGTISQEISLTGGYAVVQLDTNEVIDGVGESFTITFCEPEDAPPQELWVNTVWDDGDGDTSNDNTDIDTWVVNNTEGGDSVGWSSSNREWAALDIDDTNGYGPENIKTVPGYTAGEYEVKIHYYSDHFNGPTTPTVRVVYVDPTDSTVCDVTASQIMERGEWWTVGMFGPGLACPN